MARPRVVPTARCRRVAALGVALGLIGGLAGCGDPHAPGMAAADAIMAATAPSGTPGVGRDRFQIVEDSPVHVTAEDPISTFSIDVDTASYAFIRRALTGGVLPPPAAVRTEELINYFPYAYARPTSPTSPFTIATSLVPCPWAEDRRLLVIGVQGYDLPPEQRPRANLTLLVDVSGSMAAPDKLPLVKQALRMLVQSGLQPEDRVAIAVYAGAAGEILPPTPVRDRQAILDAIARMEAGGSTAGGAGLALAYRLAESAFDRRAVNRVIVATDGDFNVGLESVADLTAFIDAKRKTGIFLSVLGVGTGNYNDALMQGLAQHGNGVAAYIDTAIEARRVLVDHSAAALFPIATDVKIQVEFNPAQIAEWRQIGYETRVLRREDFANDVVDAGEVGAGSAVTAVYELVPVGAATRQVAPRRYASPGGGAPPTLAAIATPIAGEYGFVQLRYKPVGETASRLIQHRVTAADAIAWDQASADVRFAATVAGFGQLLRGGRHTGPLTFAAVVDLAQAARGDDRDGRRAEFVQLVKMAERAAPRTGVGR